MRNASNKNRSKLWLYEFRSRLWTDTHLQRPFLVRWVKAKVKAETLSRHKLRDLYVNLVRDYPGMWLLPDDSCGWPDTDCFETDGIDLWFRDWPNTQSDRVEHPNSIARVKTLGSIYMAYEPLPSLKLRIVEATREDRYNEDWEEKLRAYRSKPSGNDY